jgi:hypothetical protein
MYITSLTLIQIVTNIINKLHSNDDELYTNLLSLFNLMKPAQWPTLLLEGEERFSN